jgi:hypothetical protein
MSQRLDELFAVERLRRSWSGTAANPPDEAVQEVRMPEETGLRVRDVVAELKGMISRRFSEERRIPLEALLEELDVLVDRIFPRGPGPAPEPEHLQELTRSLTSVCDDLEDMIEALELAEPEDRSRMTR